MPLPPLPPVPPEVWTWLEAVLKSLFSGLCPAPTPEQLLAQVKSPGLIKRLRLERGMAQKFRDAHLQDDWKAHRGDYMDMFLEEGKAATLDDCKTFLGVE